MRMIIAATALALILTLSAEARPSRPRDASTMQVSRVAAELAALRGQVDRLNKRLDAQSSAPLPTPLPALWATALLPEPMPFLPDIQAPAMMSALDVIKTGGRFLGGTLRGVHPHLVEVVREAAHFLPIGYSAKIESGRRNGRRGFHPRGLAADLRIYDDKGAMLGGTSGWYQNAKTFRVYESYAQAAKAIQVQKYPNERFTWGGYFKNRGPGSYGFADLMHMQWGGPMAGGTWKAGAIGVTRRWLERGGGESVGIADLTKFAAAIPASVIRLASIEESPIAERPRIRRPHLRRAHHQHHRHRHYRVRYV